MATIKYTHDGEDDEKSNTDNNKHFTGANVIGVYEGKAFSKLHFKTDRGSFEISCPFKVDLELYLDVKVDGKEVRYGKFVEKFEIESCTNRPVEEKSHDFITVRSLQFEKCKNKSGAQDDTEAEAEAGDKWELAHGKLVVELDWIRHHTPLETHRVELSATYGTVETSEKS